MSEPYDLPPGGSITRFLHHDRQLRNPPHYREFMPRNGEVSVADINHLTPPEIWQLGLHTLNPSAGRGQVCGRADLTVDAINRTGLRAVRDDTGFLRHGAIVAWPARENARVRQKFLATELARAATLVIADPPIPAPPTAP